MSRLLTLTLILLSLLACSPASREWLDWETTKALHDINTRPRVHCYSSSRQTKGGYTSSTHCY